MPFNIKDINHKHRREEKSQQIRRHLSIENGRWMSGFPVYRDSFEALSCALFSSITKTLIISIDWKKNHNKFNGHLSTKNKALRFLNKHSRCLETENPSLTNKVFEGIAKTQQQILKTLNP